MTSPYLEHAVQHLAAGYSPLPVPYGKKAPPPQGWTGADAPMASRADVETWREDSPTANIAARLPAGVAAIDVDTYDGKQGAATIAAAEADWGPLPATPYITSRGGDHPSRKSLFRLPRGTRLRGQVGPGVEVLQGHHRYALAAGSLHPDGELVRAYRADGSALPDGCMPHIESLAALPLDWVAGLAAEERAAPAPTTHEEYDALPQDRRAAVDRYIAKTIQALQVELHALHALPVGQTDEHDRGWEKGCADVAWKLGGLARATWNALTLAEAEAAYVSAAPTDSTWTAAKVRAKWLSQCYRGDARPWPASLDVEGGEGAAMVAEMRAAEGSAEAPQPSAGAEQAESKAKGGIPATFVVQFVQARYDVAVTPSGEVHATPKQGARLPVMLGASGGALRHLVTAEIYAATGEIPGSKAMDDAFRVVLAQAHTSTRVVPLHLRIAPHDGGLVIDLAQQANARCVVVTADGKSVQENPPAGVLFRRTAASRAVPAPRARGDLSPLRELLGFSEDDHRWDLVRGWLVAAAFPNIARPLLAFLGPAGSTKTTKAKTALAVLDPRDELGSAFGKNLGDDQVKAQGRYLVGYDNLTSVSGAVSDHVCRLVSGDEIDKRRLYSDTEQIVITYRRTGALTAIALPPLKPDALERVIPIALDRVPDHLRRSEIAITRAFAEAHPLILGGLCDALVTVLRNLPKVQAEDIPRPRMADYFDVVRAYDPAAADAYAASTKTTMIDAAEADPFVATLAAWLREAGLPWRGTAAQAHQAAGAYRADLFSSSWWPSSASTFSAAVARAAEPLRAVGFDFSTRRSNGHRLLIFSTMQGDADLATSTGSAAA